jgi:hypothetical protein
VTALPKPDELLALHDVTAELFDTLRRWFDVPASVPLDLADIDSAVTQLGDPQMIAAMAMRKLQALRLLATPGVRTTTDVVVTMVQDLNRALVQAPNMRLHRAAETTDWDAELATLADADPEAGVGVERRNHPAAGMGMAPAEADDADPEAERFQVLHTLLHAAVFAVLEASEGEIRHFE